MESCRQACEYEDKKFNSSINIDVKNMEKDQLMQIESKLGHFSKNSTPVCDDHDHDDNHHNHKSVADLQSKIFDERPPPRFSFLYFLAVFGNF